MAFFLCRHDENGGVCRIFFVFLRFQKEEVKIPYKRDLLKVQPTEFRLRPGRILISVPFHNDAIFNRAVVLLTDYGVAGVSGLILNRRLPFRVGRMVPDLHVNTPMFLGGPVKPEILFLIHNFDKCGPAVPVAPNIYIGYDKILLALIEKASVPNLRYRFLMGYAGWSKGQLETEVRKEMWVIGNPTTDLVFKTSPEKIWSSAVKTLGEEYEDWLKIPEDISSN